MPDPAGKMPNAEISRTFRTRQEAEDWLASQRHSQLAGTYIDPRRAEAPFADVVAEWRQSWSARLSPTTARRYASILETYLLPEFASVPVGRIDHGVVQRYVDRLKDAAHPDKPDTPLHAPGTVRNVYAVLRTCMAKAVRTSLIAANPCVDIDLPKPARQEMLFLSAEEVSAVAEKIDPHYSLPVLFSAYTGLRAGELAGLQRQDVDLLRGVVHVRRSVRDVNGRLLLGDLKTEHSRRTVTLPAFLREMLADHLASSVSGGTGPEAYVFAMKGGGPLRMGLVYGRYFRRAVRGWTDGRGRQHPGALPDKPGLRWHDLRHTCAALSIAAGAHPKLISARLGHSTIQITLDRYGHLFPSAEESLGVALDAAFVSAGAVTAESNVTPLRS
jgi:integrase